MTQRSRQAIHGRGRVGRRPAAAVRLAKLALGVGERPPIGGGIRSPS
jgi:hypothetical protein